MPVTGEDPPRRFRMTYSGLRLVIRMKARGAFPKGSTVPFWEFPKIRGALFGVLIIRILLFRVLY